MLTVLPVSLISLRYARFDNIQMIFSNILAAFVALHYPVIIIYQICSISAITKPKKDKTDQNGEEGVTKQSTTSSLVPDGNPHIKVIYGELNKKRRPIVGSLLLSKISKGLISLIVVMGAGNSTLQLGTVIFCLVTTLVYLTVVKPYYSAWVSRTQLVKYFLLALIYSAVFVTGRGVGVHLKEGVKHNYIGYGVAGLAGATFLLISAGTIISMLQDKPEMPSQDYSGEISGIEDQKSKILGSEIEIPMEGPEEGLRVSRGKGSKLTGRIPFKPSNRMEVSNKLEFMNSRISNMGVLGFGQSRQSQGNELKLGKEWSKGPDQLSELGFGLKKTKEVQKIGSGRKNAKEVQEEKKDLIGKAKKEEKEKEVANDNNLDDVSF